MEGDNSQALCERLGDDHRTLRQTSTVQRLPRSRDKKRTAQKCLTVATVVSATSLCPHAVATASSAAARAEVGHSAVIAVPRVGPHRRPQVRRPPGADRPSAAFAAQPSFASVSSDVTSVRSAAALRRKLPERFSERSSAMRRASSSTRLRHASLDGAFHNIFPRSRTAAATGPSTELSALDQSVFLSARAGVSGRRRISARITPGQPHTSWPGAAEIPLKCARSSAVRELVSSSVAESPSSHNPADAARAIGGGGHLQTGANVIVSTDERITVNAESNAEVAPNGIAGAGRANGDVIPGASTQTTWDVDGGGAGRARMERDGSRGNTRKGIRAESRGGRRGRGFGASSAVRSGGTLTSVFRPLFDALDAARGRGATGAAAMRILKTGDQNGWADVRFSALRVGKVAAGAAAAGCWESHGRDLIERMPQLGIDTQEVSAWTAVLLGISRLGFPEECLDVMEVMKRSIVSGRQDSDNGGVDVTSGLTSPHGAAPDDGRVVDRAPGWTARRNVRDRKNRRGRNAVDWKTREDDMLTVAHNHCMFAFIKAGRYEETVQRFDEYFRRPVVLGDGEDPDSTVKVSPDLFSYTHLLSALEKLGRERACLAALTDMRENGVKADTYTFASAMKALGAKGEWETAVTLLHQLREEIGVPPDVYVYTAAISACADRGQWEAALSLVADMRRYNVRSNAYTVTSCISALANAGQWEKAVEELEKAEAADVPISTPAYNAALKSFATAKVLEPGLDFLRNMQEQGSVPLDEQTYNIAIELCKECEETQMAVAMLEEMRRNGFPPSVVSYNTALGACEAKGDFQLALRLLGLMNDPEGRVNPDVWSYNIALGTCAKVGKWDVVESLLEEMNDVLGGLEEAEDYDHQQPRSSQSHQNRDIDSLMTQSASALASRGLQRQERHQHLPIGMPATTMGNDKRAARHSFTPAPPPPPPSRNFITFATLIMAADSSGEPRRCLEHYAEMGRWGILPNRSVYDAVARACVSYGSWRWAVLVHKDALARGMADDWTSAAAVVAHVALGQQDAANRLIERALNEGELTMDGSTEFSPLSAAAGQAMKALAKAEEWESVSKLFDIVVQVATPTMHVQVMYVRAQAALAASSASTSSMTNESSSSTVKMFGAPEVTSPSSTTENDYDGDFEDGDDADFIPARGVPDIVPAGTVHDNSDDVVERASDPMLMGGGGDDGEVIPGGVPRKAVVRGQQQQQQHKLAAQSAVQAIERLEALNLDVGVNEYTAALFACAGDGCGESALAILRGMRKRELPCDTRAAAGALTALTRCRDVQGAEALADELALSSIVHNAYSATAAISAYGRAGRLEDAMDVLDGLLEVEDPEKPVATTAVFNAGIMACARAGDLEEGMSLLREMWDMSVPRDVRTYNTVMALCKGVGAWTRAVGLLDAMEAEGIAPDAVTFNTVIASCESGADHWTAFSLFNQMERSGISPNVWTYNSLAIVLGSCGEWERAVALLDDMRERGLNPDVVTYTSLISACEKAGQVEAGLDLLQRMSAEGVLANERTFSAAIKALTSASSSRTNLSSGDSSAWPASYSRKPTSTWSKVAKLHEEAKSRGMANVVTYSAAISACAKEKRWEDALSLLAEMRQDGITPNAYSYSAAMWACVNAGQGKRALQLFATIMDAPGTSSRPSPASTHTSDGGVAVVETAVDEGGEEGGGGCSRQCYMAAIMACQKDDDFPRAIALLQHMRRKGVRGSLGLYNLVLSMSEKHGDAETSKKLLTLMRVDRVSPSVVSCNQVISACEKAGRWEDAVAILRAMLLGGVRPNVYTVCSALRACCLGDSPARAVKLLDELRGSMGMAVALPVYNTLVCSFHREGRYELADFFYKVAYREDVINHWEQSAEGGGQFEAIPASQGRDGTRDFVMDLHGHSLPLAHAAVRCALEEIWRYSQKQDTAVGDLTIITGVGKGSLHAFQPVVRPEVQRLLMEEFYPPIHSATEVGNAGRVVVTAEAIEAWLKHNMEAKRPVMARLAAKLQQLAEAQHFKSEDNDQSIPATADGEQVLSEEELGDESFEDEDEEYLMEDGDLLPDDQQYDALENDSTNNSY